MSTIISAPTRFVDSKNSVFGVESMFLTKEVARTTPWADLATVVDEAPTSDVALRLAGLDWTVERSELMYTDNTGTMRPTGQLANFRTDNGGFLGTVTKTYQPMQNADAFAFCDYLVDSGSAAYSSAGSLKGGAITFVSLELPTTDVLGDLHDRYIVVVNDFTGRHALRIVPTTIRVTCMNTVNLMLAKAKRIISIAHVGDVQQKLEAAKQSLFASQQYTEELKAEAERLAKVKVSKADLENLLNQLFPIPEEGCSKQRANNIVYMRGLFDRALKAPDLANFAGTAYGVVQAAADAGYHRQSLRKNPLHGEGIFSQLLTGSKLLDTTYAWAKELAA